MVESNMLVFCWTKWRNCGFKQVWSITRGTQGPRPPTASMYYFHSEQAQVGNCFASLVQCFRLMNKIILFRIGLTKNKPQTNQGEHHSIHFLFISRSHKIRRSSCQWMKSTQRKFEDGPMSFWISAPFWHSWRIYFIPYGCTLFPKSLSPSHGHLTVSKLNLTQLSFSCNHIMNYRHMCICPHSLFVRYTKSNMLEFVWKSRVTASTLGGRLWWCLGH